MKKSTLLGAVIFIAGIFSACTPTSQQGNQQRDTETDSVVQDQAFEASSELEQLPGSQGQADQFPSDSQAAVSGLAEQASSQATYIDYSPTAVAEATTDQGKAVLFFHAAWCPTCKAAERDFLQNMSNLPENLTIIKVDYDSENELKKKYAVTYQHTFVQVDADGQEITRWSGGESRELIQRLQ